MARIIDHARSSKLMVIDITYGSERYIFNLANELKIDEVTVNRELKNQPTSYSFICMLHEKLIHRFELLENLVEKRYNQLYVKYKSDTRTTYYTENGKFPSDDLCKAMCIKNKDYQNLIKKMLTIKNQRDIIKTAVRGFEQRSFLIQTLSANIRKQS